MPKRLFSHDPEAGITKWWHWDEMSDTVMIETVQDVQAIIDQNVANQNETTSLDRWGDGKIVASIPMTEYAKLLVGGKIHDQAYMRRWLNDPDNRKFRTRLGRV
jgi:hypothetical protein